MGHGNEYGVIIINTEVPLSTPQQHQHQQHDDCGQHTHFNNSFKYDISISLFEVTADQLDLEMKFIYLLLSKMTDKHAPTK